MVTHQKTLQRSPIEAGYLYSTMISGAIGHIDDIELWFKPVAIADFIVQVLRNNTVIGSVHVVSVSMNQNVPGTITVDIDVVDTDLIKFRCLSKVSGDYMETMTINFEVN